jgi:predicted  nucleic acid-binding Zn-ribbon protein
MGDQIHPPMKELINNLLELQTLELDKTVTADADQITKLRAKIPEKILTHYGRLGDRGKKGVVAVRNNVCTGCHMHVRLAVTMTMMRGDDIQTCESCGRYLYLVQPAETPKATRRKKAAAIVDKGDPQL